MTRDRPQLRTKECFSPNPVSALGKAFSGLPWELARGQEGDSALMTVTFPTYREETMRADPIPDAMHSPTLISAYGCVTQKLSDCTIIEGLKE